MMGFDSTDHHSQEPLVDCGYTKVIASRVGALGTSFVRAAKPGDFTRAKREKPPREESSVPRFPQGKLREFALEELKKATANFSSERLLGRGGFGEVFKGILSDGAVVAVKVLDKGSRESPKQFQAEMTVNFAIMSISHPNLVPAIGYHSSCKKKTATIMIVYPFMANGDVSLYLGDREPSPTPFDWTTRKRIVLGVARGICGLHEHRIVHRDIKPSNVMLDENFDAQIGDFGLAKSIVLPCNSCDVTGLHGDLDSYHYDITGVCGTMGYISPEYLFLGQFSRESDVYAFGVTLIQIVTGKPLFDESEEDTRLFILDRAKQLLKNDEDLTRHMHPCMLGMYDESEAIELIRLGLICAQNHPEKRPFMPEVIAIMEGSSANLKQRWDDYVYSWGDGHFLFNNLSETDSDIYSHSTRCSYVGADRSQSGDEENEEEVRGTLNFDIKEEPEETGCDGNQSRRVDDFVPEPEESNKEHRAGLACFTNSRSLENDSDEIVVVDLNEGGNQEQLSTQDYRHEGQSDEVATKLGEVLDQMRAMEEMHQKQIVMMQTMIKMQEQCIQKVNEMQTQIDQLKEASQKL